MNRRVQPKESLDFFPTPPWATRALLEHLIPNATGICWEPACGQGDMVHPLAERFGKVIASDIHDYGGGEVRDFMAGPGNMFWDSDPASDWVITNPPFNCAERFALRALGVARVGVALLVRLTFLETPGRYQRLFTVHPPTEVGVFAERVVIVEGRLDPDGGTATAYAWIVWEKAHMGHGTELRWIPPCRKRLERRSDYR